MSLIARIKEKISLREMARMLGITGLPDHDDIKFASPLRPDGHPSCTIWHDRLVDWSRDERWDAIDLYETVKGVPRNIALHELARIAGIGNNDQNSSDKNNGGGKWPPFSLGTKIEAQVLCEIRGFTLDGLRLARDRGMLAFASVCRLPCWIVTDNERVLAQARRLDGRWFPPFKGLAERKSHTLRGSKQGHVLGVADVGKYDFLLLVEGGPDIVAAHCFIAMREAGERDRIGVLGILGASHGLPVKVARACKGKWVRVFDHADLAGKETAARWRMSLHATGVKTDMVSFESHNGKQIFDLNDQLIHDPTEALVTQFRCCQSEDR